ncbi:MAG: hypothetical protein C4531_07105 [Desulfurivibrio sp.]|jgi:hypothetical protein|nr:MAG: hypothetical protein C4531_07105 [Desulfurivibrio sp.]
MNKSYAGLVIFGLTGLLMVAPAFADASGQPEIFEKTYGEWSAKWWQWLEAQNFTPLTAQGEVDCSQGQTGPVWFLAGTDGSGPVERECTVPKGTLLFFPLVNAEFNNVPNETTCEGGPCTEDEKRVILDGLMSDNTPGLLNSRACNLESTVDGIPTLFSGFAIARTQSPAFLYLDDHETVSDGFWVMLSLPEGQHTLHFKGALCDLDSGSQLFEVDVTYNLNVSR